MNRPLQSYRIWHSPRVGSSLLCQLLIDTQIAGNPGEHFTLHGESSFAEKYQVESYDAFREAFWNLSTKGQGIAGVKSGAHHEHDQVFYQELFAWKGLPTNSDPALLFNDLLPNCKHILLVRNNKIRQAVSWWKAIQDQTWHLSHEQTYTQSADFYKDKYDFNALKHLYQEATLRDIAAQAYLEQHGLSRLTIAYEDLIAHPKKVLQRVLDYLEIKFDFQQMPAFYYQQTANAINEEWVQRFREEFQQEFGQRVW
ncbi:MAG: Stf0 family sulfotransferase [Bacteroidota bacterium]